MDFDGFWDAFSTLGKAFGSHVDGFFEVPFASKQQ